jgi:hypothetical protein
VEQFVYVTSAHICLNFGVPPEAQNSSVSSIVFFRIICSISFSDGGPRSFLLGPLLKCVSR